MPDAAVTISTVNTILSQNQSVTRYLFSDIRIDGDITCFPTRHRLPDGQLPVPEAPASVWKRCFPPQFGSIRDLQQSPRNLAQCAGGHFGQFHRHFQVTPIDGAGDKFLDFRGKLPELAESPLFGFPFSDQSR